MHKPLRFAYAAAWAIVLTMSACKPEPEAVAPLEQQTTSLPKKNPYSITVVNEALAHLRETTPNGRTMAVSVLQPTHKYVRFHLYSVETLMELEETGMELFDAPLDQEDYVASVAKDGSPVTDDGPVTHKVPEEGMIDQTFYTVLPISYVLPTYVTAQVLDQLFLYDEFAGDERDEETIPDPWVPDPPPPTCLYEWNSQCQCWMLCPSARKATKVNAIREATHTLTKAGIDPLALYNETMQISGHPDGVVTPEVARSARKYRPSGRITVDETALGVPVPVKGVLVKAKRWFKLSDTYTDGDGRFSLGKEFRKRATLIVKFKNNAATVRGITAWWKLWQYALPAQHTLGVYTKEQMENMNYHFTYTPTANSGQAVHFVAATFMNTLWDTYINNQNNSLPLPAVGLNVWLMDGLVQAASTPMLRRIGETSKINQGIDLFLAGTPYGLAKKVIQRYIPDITYRYNTPAGTRQSAELTNVIFHELAHATHYQQVGNNYWVAYITKIISNSISTGDPFGVKHSDGSGRIAVSEAWGEYIGDTYAAQRYDGTTRQNLAEAFRRELENQVPADDIPDRWIPFGMLHDMTDVPEPPVTGVVDNVSTYTINQIFKGMQANVVTVRGFQQEVLLRNNNQQANQMEQLVTSYRY